MSELEQLFHQLWGECKDGVYDKTKWIKAQKLLEQLLYGPTKQDVTAETSRINAEVLRRRVPPITP